MGADEVGRDEVPEGDQTDEGSEEGAGEEDDRLVGELHGATSLATARHSDNTLPTVFLSQTQLYVIQKVLLLIKHFFFNMMYFHV